MSFLEFVSQFIDSIVWPALVAWLVYGFRAPITALLGRLSSLKYKEFAAEFEKKLEDIEIPAQLDERIAIEDKSGEETISINELSEVSPRAAIMEAWINIESATRAYLESIGIEHRYSYQGLRRLSTEQLRPIESIMLPYQELRLLRNKAAHAPEFDLTPDIAKKYIAIAEVVEFVIREAIQ